MGDAGPKSRADVALVARGLAQTRAKAQALIMAGEVFSGERRIAKAGEPIRADQPLALRRRDHPWVSRGGMKLAHALEVFDIDASGSLALDIGASTGGFSEVLLTHGARRVTAVDVGRGQLAWPLRQDDRIVVLERTNARYLTAEDVPEPVDLIVCDTSFISLETVLPAPLARAAGGARLVALIKPQFEVGRERVGDKGVVRDPALHSEVCARIRDWLEGRGWQVFGLTESPIAGPQGNTEFLIGAQRH